VIPAEAIEAAAKAIYGLGVPDWHWDERDKELQDLYRDDARAALEAAAPHMLKGAYDLGFLHGSTEPPNPYRESNREHLEQFREWEPGDPIE
jgi:hypothetical protein